MFNNFLLNIGQTVCMCQLYNIMYSISGYVDDIIEPRITRRRICQDLEILSQKKLKNPWKKHGNIPL